MLTCLSQFTGGKKFETSIRGHRIVADQPLDQGGADAGPSPPELLLAALGTCAGHYAHEYLRARSLPERVEVDVEAEKGGQPARLISFRIGVRVERLDERHKSGLLRAVKTCLIHNTLTSSPAIDVELRMEGESGSTVPGALGSVPLDAPPRGMAQVRRVSDSASG